MSETTPETSDLREKLSEVLLHAEQVRRRWPTCPLDDVIDPDLYRGMADAMLPVVAQEIAAAEQRGREAGAQEQRGRIEATLLQMVEWRDLMPRTRENHTYANGRHDGVNTVARVIRAALAKPAPEDHP
jgi:hypothetical protein